MSITFHPLFPERSKTKTLTKIFFQASLQCNKNILKHYQLMRKKFESKPCYYIETRNSVVPLGNYLFKVNNKDIKTTVHETHVTLPLILT